MAPNTYRVLKRRGRVTLVETANPILGVGYSIRDHSLGLWSGQDLAEAEAQFERAVGESVD